MARPMAQQAQELSAHGAAFRSHVLALEAIVQTYNGIVGSLQPFEQPLVQQGWGSLFIQMISVKASFFSTRLFPLGANAQVFQFLNIMLTSRSECLGGQAAAPKVSGSKGL